MASDGTKKYEKAFDIILSGVDELRIDALTPELASAFSLDGEAAGYILKSAPIVFLQGMSKGDVRHIKKHLVELSKIGAEFTITTQAAADLPKVVWANKPKFGEGGSGETISELRFDLGRNAFVCPGCGETFLFRRVGQLAHKLTAATAAPAMKQEPVAAAAKPAAPSPTPSRSSGRSAPSPRVEEEALEAVVPLESIEMLEKGGVEEIDEVPEAATPPPPPMSRKGGKPAPPPKVVKEEEELEEAEELEPDMEVAADDLSEDMDLGSDDSEEEEPEEIAEIEEVEEAEEMEELADAEEEEAPARPAPGKGRGAAATKEKEKATPEKASAKTPAKISYGAMKKPDEKEEELEEDEDDGGGEGGDDVQFSVFLSRIPTPDKQSAAAKLISDMRGVSMAEAKELASRMVIPVLKDVSKDEAEKCLEKFKKIKVSGRMTKKK